METEIKNIKAMAMGWLNDDECCIDRLMQIYSEEMMMLERSAAGGVDAEANLIYTALENRLQKEYAGQ